VFQLDERSVSACRETHDESSRPRRHGVVDAPRVFRAPTGEKSPARQRKNRLSARSSQLFSWRRKAVLPRFQPFRFQQFPPDSVT
jgi:hypothetical protein